MIAPPTRLNRRQSRRTRQIAPARDGLLGAISNGPAEAPLEQDPFAHLKAPLPAAATADVAECECPGFCERDHDVD